MSDADGTGGGGGAGPSGGVTTGGGGGVVGGGVAVTTDAGFILTNDFIPSPGDISLLAEVAASYTAQSDIEGIYVTTSHLVSVLQRSRH